MFVYRFVLLVSIINIALSVETDDDISVNVHQPRQLSVYSYNHPPLFEEYENDHVSENQKAIMRRDAKSIAPPTARSLDNEKESEDTSESIRKTKSQSVEEVSQIPVSVVYDKISDANSKPVSSPTENKLRKRNQRRRNKEANREKARQNNLSAQQPVQANEITTKKQEVTTLKPTPVPSVTPTTVSNHDVTLFPKRPAEDSKRIEFQRRSRERPPVVKILDEKNFVYSHTGNFHYRSVSTYLITC